MELFEPRCIPVGRIRFEQHLVVVALALRDDLPVPLRQLALGTLSLALVATRRLFLLITVAERSNLDPERFELERVLLDRLVELALDLGVGRRDEVEQNLFGIVGLDGGSFGELGVVRDVEVLLETARREAELQNMAREDLSVTESTPRQVRVLTHIHTKVAVTEDGLLLTKDGVDERCLEIVDQHLLVLAQVGRISLGTDYETTQMK